MLERLSPEWWLEELLDRGWEYKKAKLFEHYMGLVSIYAFAFRNKNPAIHEWFN